MAGRLYRMAKVVSANPKSWGIVDANEISGFKRVAKLSDLYSIAECILSSSYGDGVTDGADAVGQIWHVSETNGDYKLTNWASRKSAAGWTKLSYGGDVSVPVKDVQVNGTTVLSNGIANVNLNSYLQNYATLTTTDTLEGKINKNLEKINANLGQINSIKNRIGAKKVNNIDGIATLDKNGCVPIEQLANLDTTVYKVLGTNEALPTTGIKSCIYLKLIETGNPTGDNNKYAEYVYTGDPSVTYDATKWEKLGEVAAKTDLSEYYKKTEVYNKDEIDTKVNTLNSSINDYTIDKFTAIAHVAARPNDEHKDQYKLNISLINGDNKTAYIKPATNTESGVMTSTQKSKLDGIEAKANNYTHPTYTAATEGLYRITVDSLGHVSATTPAINYVSHDGAYTVIGSNENNELFNLGGALQVVTQNNITTIVAGDNSGIFAGTAEKAKADADGKIISATYWKKTDLVALTDTELNNILN